MHEAKRVYGDKLVDLKDFEQFDETVKGICKNVYEDLEADELFKVSFPISANYLGVHSHFINS